MSQLLPPYPFHIIFYGTYLLSQLNSYHQSPVFYSNQHGILYKSISCETQLAFFVNDIILCVDAAFLDFAKAFDKVPHDQLYLKISSIPTRWFAHG